MQDTSVPALLNASRFPRSLDRLGVVASSLCLVHCIATPLLVISFPLMASERFEGTLAGLLVGLATVSVGLSLARRRLLPLLPYCLGLSTLALVRANDMAEAQPLELVGSTVAALLMICTHLMSLRAGVADVRFEPPSSPPRA